MANKPSQAAKDAATTKTPEAPKAPKAPKAAPKPLEGEALKQMTAISDASQVLLTNLEAATEVPVRNLRQARKALGMAFGKVMKSRKVDPKVRKRERLESAIERATKALAELNAAEEKK